MIFSFRGVFLSVIAMAAFLQSGLVCKAKSWQDSYGVTLPSVVEYNAEGDPVGFLERSMAYRYFLPKDYDPSIKYPLVLFLHGSGESGHDNTRQVSLFLENMINQTDSNYPAILLAPQLLRSVGWAPWQSLDRTDEILDTMLSDFSVDRNRLYVTGLSMGGFGTMSYLHHYNAYEPGTLQFAAAAPTAGAWINTDVADVLSETPIWLGHGSSDDVVSPDSSRETFNALAGYDLDARIRFDQRGAGGPMAEVGNVRYTEYPGVGHHAWNRFYDTREFYEWMFSQSLVPEPSSLASAAVGLILVASRRRS